MIIFRLSAARGKVFSCFHCATWKKHCHAPAHHTGATITLATACALMMHNDEVHCRVAYRVAPNEMLCGIIYVVESLVLKQVAIPTTKRGYPPDAALKNVDLFSLLLVLWCSSTFLVFCSTWAITSAAALCSIAMQ